MLSSEYLFKVHSSRQSGGQSFERSVFANALKDLANGLVLQSGPVRMFRFYTTALLSLEGYLLGVFSQGCSNWQAFLYLVASFPRDVHRRIAESYEGHCPSSSVNYQTQEFQQKHRPLPICFSVQRFWGLLWLRKNAQYNVSLYESAYWANDHWIKLHL